MTLRKGLALSLSAVVVMAAPGCSDKQEKINVSRHGDMALRPVTDAQVAHARPAKPPKILPETHFAAGRLFESQGKFVKAIQQYRKAVAVNHHYVEAYHRLGIMLSLTGQRDEALDAFRRAVELRPDDPVLRNNLGFELLLAERPAEAEAEFSEALYLKPDFARAYINLGIAKARQGQFDDALASFRTVLPEADAYYNLGLMYRGQKKYQDAAETFRRVLDVNPEFRAAEVQLAQLKPYLKSRSAAPVEPEARLAQGIPFAEELREPAPLAQVRIGPAKGRPIHRERRTAGEARLTPHERESQISEEEWAEATALLDEVLLKPNPPRPPKEDWRSDRGAFGAEPCADDGPRGIEAQVTRHILPADDLSEFDRFSAQVLAETTIGGFSDAATGMSLLDEPMSSSSGTWFAFDFTPWNLTPREEGLHASTDSWALLRELETQLSIVRNDIRCLEDRAQQSFLARQELMGPPAELAGEGDLPPIGVYPPARLASERLDDPDDGHDNGVRRQDGSPTQWSTPNDRRERRERRERRGRDLKETDDRWEPTRRSMLWRQSFERLEDLVEIARNEIRCLDEESRDGGFDRVGAAEAMPTTWQWLLAAMDGETP